MVAGMEMTGGKDSPNSCPERQSPDSLCSKHDSQGFARPQTLPTLTQIVVQVHIFRC